MEHIAGAHDIAFADFNRGRMAHRPGWFGGGTDLSPFAAGKGNFVAISFIRLTGFKDKSRLAVEGTSLATVLAPPRSAKSGKGMGSVTGGAGGGGQQKSGTVKTTRNWLLLRAILLTAMGALLQGLDGDIKIDIR